MLTIESVTKKYSEFLALDNINISFTGGEIVGLLGPNGAGKTTLLRIIGTILRASSGKVLYKGVDIDKIGVPYRESIGYMPEDGGLYLRLTPVQNLKFYMSFYSSAMSEKRIEQYLDEYNLQEFRTKQTGQLSKGTKQKILFLKSIINNPELLILDEPLNNLDPEIRVLVKKELKKRRETGNLIILSSHSLSEIEDICNTIAVIRRGKILASDSLDHLKSRYANGHCLSLESIYLKIIKDS